MTALTWDEAGYAFDVSNFDWDGNEIASSLTDPTTIPIKVIYIPTISRIGSP